MISLRKVMMSDMLSLLRWKNDPVTRRNAIVTGDMIGLEEHIRWLKGTLADPRVEFYIICQDQPCGDLRFDVKEEIEVSIRLDPEYRGRGIGTHAVKMGCAMVQPKHKKNMVARIVDGNIASMNVFIHNGFKFVDYKNGGHGFYTLRRSYEVNLRG